MKRMILCCMVILCVGCDVVVYPEEMAEAEKVCENLGGLNFLVPKLHEKRNIAFCKNGKVQNYHTDKE